ncbi:MAG TPA: nickel-responsive transcriptional regulator NikR [Burkholderiaceae bacterium]|jgi:CopG family nickel-responsive transcriptional regulator|nr:nickel-responsive transcriptional regulator NikR [Burkholderiaceae bacterium]HQR77568.1 nickel-responsive transcriptional regulator NikR [Burkholderiaceae bacterium]
MQRFTISLDDKLAQDFDAWIAQRRYVNRSEAVRDLLRSELERTSQKADESTDCVASLSYVYRRGELDVTRRLSTLQHDHHDLVMNSTMVPLDHEFRLETLTLRGTTGVVRQFADLLCAQRGVRHGKLNLIGMEVHEAHRHGLPGSGASKKGAAGAEHKHLRPAH